MRCPGRLLVAAFDRVRKAKEPEFVVLESETGLGKTRVLQEFYARLARRRQHVPPYWPERLDSQATGDVLRDRKRITPPASFIVPGGARMPYLWWGILCDDDESGSPVPRLADSAAQFEAHARHLAQADPDHVDTALTLAKSVAEIVGLASPLEIAVSATDAVKKGVTWFQGVWRKARTPKELAADRTIDTRALTADDHTKRLAEAVRRAATKGLTIVLVVDDAHHADPMLVSFLRQLTQLDGGSVLVVLACWPSRLREQAKGGPSSLAGLLDATRARFGARFKRIELGKLERTAVASLLLEVAPLTRQEIVESFCDVIDGNPLFLRLYLDLNSVKSDIKDGALDTDPASFKRLPSTAQGVWQALWGQLPAESQLALAVVSMQGPEFHPGFLEKAAAALGEFDKARKGYAGAGNTYGWVAPEVAQLGSFTERLRYEIARENLDQQLVPEQKVVVRKALIAHAVETRRSPDWSGLPATTRRTILTSHVAAAQEEPQRSSAAEAAEAALELSALEEELGDSGVALDAARAAVQFAREANDPHSLLMCQARLAALEKSSGNDEAAFEAINAAEVLSREVLGEGSETAAALQEAVQEAVADLVQSEREAPGAMESEAWLAWTPRHGSIAGPSTRSSQLQPGASGGVPH